MQPVSLNMPSRGLGMQPEFDMQLDMLAVYRE